MRTDKITTKLIITTILPITIFCFTSMALALSDEKSDDLKKDYEAFKKDYTDALNLTNDKTEFLNKFKITEKKLLQQLNTYSKKEGKTLTNEGNQMALDIENLEPLRIIANGQASQESCSNARFINELNNADDKKMYNDIQNKIEKICK